MEASMRSHESEAEGRARERRKNPMFGIVVILIIGMAAMTFFAPNEDEDEDQMSPWSVWEEVWENPGDQDYDWVQDIFEDRPFAAISETRQIAREIRVVENYGPEYSRQRLNGHDFRGENLPGASFRYVSLEEANFNSANLEDAFFGLADLKNADFTNA